MSLTVVYTCRNPVFAAATELGEHIDDTVLDMETELGTLQKDLANYNNSLLCIIIYFHLCTPRLHGILQPFCCVLYTKILVLQRKTVQRC